MVKNESNFKTHENYKMYQSAKSVDDCNNAPK